MGNWIETQYLHLLEDILEQGVKKTDRTGTGTISVFGRQIRHKMKEGFPLLTTKKMAFKTMVTELLWFLRGDTNIKYLVDNNCHIWDGDAYKNYKSSNPDILANDEMLKTEKCTYKFFTQEEFINKIKTDDKFAKKWGYLGPIYGAGWRRWRTNYNSSVPTTRPIPNLRPGLVRTYLGVANGKGKDGHMLAKTWEGMIARCYDSNSIEYPNYGACNVYVCDRWLEFRAFAEDAEKLNNWDLKKENPRGYVLDKDGIGTGYIYSLESCQWITPTENANLKSTKIYTVERGGIKYTFTNPTSFCNEQNISNKNFSDLWTGTKNAKKRNGFTLVSVDDIKDKVYIDQISNLINELKTNPDSRRMMVNAWNVEELENMFLPPCHFSFQCYTRELSHKEKVDWVISNCYETGMERYSVEQMTDKQFHDDYFNTPKRAISLMWNQRSVDTFLGLPFNIASYGLLLEIIAKEVNMIPEELIGNLGDVHLYNNHIEQAKEQITRTPYKLPEVRLRNYNTLDELLNTTNSMDMIQLWRYDSHPTIKAPLSN
jgi:thymidylate synthase